jgi:hypothetical protein
MPIYQQGFLTALVQGLGNLRIPATVMVAGTAFSLSNAEQVFTSANKRDSVRLVTQFRINH